MGATEGDDRGGAKELKEDEGTGVVGGATAARGGANWRAGEGAGGCREVDAPGIPPSASASDLGTTGISDCAGMGAAGRGITTSGPVIDSVSSSLWVRRMGRDSRPIHILNLRGIPVILVNSLTFFVHARGRGVLLSSTMGGKNAVAILGGAPMGNARDAAGGGSELRGAGELVGDDSVDGVSRMSTVGAMGSTYAFRRWIQRVQQGYCIPHVRQRMHSTRTEGSKPTPSCPSSKTCPDQLLPRAAWVPSSSSAWEFQSRPPQTPARLASSSWSLQRARREPRSSQLSRRRG